MKINKIIKIYLIIIIFFVGCNTRNVDSKYLWQYAIKYKPCDKKTLDNICYDLNLSKEGKYLVSECIKDDLYKKSILLIYLKLYKEQMLKYNQTFDLRENTIKGRISFFYEDITLEFTKIVGNKEFLSPAEAYYYLKDNKTFIPEKEMVQQITSIDSIREELDKQNSNGKNGNDTD